MRSFLHFLTLHFLTLMIGVVLIGAGGLASAGMLAISIRSSGAPANDLINQGRPIDRDEAMDLKRHNVDISQLDPVSNDIWQPEVFSLRDSLGDVFPQDGAAVLFEQELSSSSGLYRARVLNSQDGTPQNSFQLLVSLNQHASMARAALLRKLGYPVIVPKHYRKLTIRFANTEARENFLNSISDSTLTTRTRWVAAMPESEATPEVTLQDVVLEPAQIDVPMYHWSVIPSGHLKGRRALRALIIPLALLDINESVNLFSWELGKVVSQSVILNHPYAESFRETTYDDARWIARKIAKLSRDDLSDVIRAASYPEDITALLIEKIIARRNHLVQMFELDRYPKEYVSALPYNARLTFGHVNEGKLIQSDYEGYALRFSYGDPESPLRPEEVWRFLAIEGISGGLSTLLAQINQFLVAHSVEDLVASHQRDVFRDLINHIRKNPGTPYSRPIGTWGGPLGKMTVSASRNVVTGTYYGSDAKVQLVDNFGIQTDFGYFLGVEGLVPVLPSASANLVLQRNLLHLRPLSDMDTALRSDWSNLYVKKFMDGLAELLVAPSGSVDHSLPKFLEALKDGEMLVVADSVVAGARGTAIIPIPLLLSPALSQFNPALGFGAGIAPTVLRRTTFVKTGKGIQIYLQDSEILHTEISFDLNWWVNVLRTSLLKKDGGGRTKAFLLDQNELSPEHEKQLTIALRALLRENKSEILESSFKEYALKHATSSNIQSTKVLAWKWAGIEQSHRVVVSPPGRPDKIRTLFLDRFVQSFGVDGFSFFSDIVAALTQGWVRLDGGSSGYYPSNSYLGSGNWVSVTTEAETTPGYGFSPTTRIEHHLAGWILSRQDLFNALDAVEAKVKPLNLDRSLVRRDVFQSTQDLQMYEVLSTLLFYPSGMKRVKKSLFEVKEIDEVVRVLTEIEGTPSLDEWCSPWWRRLANFIGRFDSYSENGDGKEHFFFCMKPWMKRVLEYRREEMAKKEVRSTEEEVRWTNKLITVIEKNVELEKFLKWLGNENFFFQIRVSGFRTLDENGDSEYVSDSIGSIQPAQSTSAFSEFAQKYGIVSSELYATYLSEGF